MKDRAKKVIAFEPPCWCPDSAGTTSRLTMFNNDELVIENFRHVIYSDDERVSVKTRKGIDRKSTRLNSSHEWIISYAVFCLKKKIF